MKRLAIIIIIFELLYAQPIVRILYPRVDSTISTPEGPYIYKAQLSQPLNPLNEIARVEIIDSTHDSIYFKGLELYYIYHPPPTGWPCTIYTFCDSIYPCPCNIIFGNIVVSDNRAIITNQIDFLRRGWFKCYTLYHCPPCCSVFWEII